MTREEIIKVFEKELSCRIGVNEDQVCGKYPLCHGCPYHNPEAALNQAYKAAIELLKEET